MPSDSTDKSYYCTQCHIETTLSPVCPKCHRKTTLRPRGQSSGSEGGQRRRASSTQLQAVGGGPRWLWYLGGLLAAGAVIGLVWWVLARPRRDPAKKKKTSPAATRSFGPPAMTSDRVFGAPRPGSKVAPPPPPRICGTSYRVTIHYRFPRTAAPASMKPGMKPASKSSMKPSSKTGKKAPARARPKGPESVEHTHLFLLAKQRGRRTYVPLAFEIRVTAKGRTFTGLKLDRNGGLLPDRRTRRPRRLGYHDSLQPGLRISDLIGRVQADLATDPAGGLKITRQRLKNRLVSQWLQTGIGLAGFLQPRPPKKGARLFEDRRLPPGGIIPGLKVLVRRFRLLPPTKKVAKPAQTTYRVDAPVLTMRRAKSTTPVKGQVTLVGSEALPRKAELTLEKIPRKGGGTQTVTLRLVHLGQRCNDR